MRGCYFLSYVRTKNQKKGVSVVTERIFLWLKVFFLVLGGGGGRFGDRIRRRRRRREDLPTYLVEGRKKKFLCSEFFNVCFEFVAFFPQM